MKAWVVEKVGFENVNLHTDSKIPDLVDENSIRIKVLAVGLNPVDWKLPGWETPFNVFPKIIGADGAGVVEKIGAGVDGTQFVEGKTLVYFHGNMFAESGAFAEYYVHDQRYLTRVPQEYVDSQDFDQLVNNLAAIPCVAFTSYQMLFNKLKLRFGYEVNAHENKKIARDFLITAGAGGCGGFTIQFLKLWKDSLDAETRDTIKIITTCSVKNAEYVKSLGATHVIDYNKENVSEAARALTDGKGIDAWIDMVGPESVTSGLETLAFGGELVAIAGSPTYDMNKLYFNANAIHHSALGFCYSFGRDDLIQEIKQMGDQILEWIQEGKVNFLPIEVVPFEEVKNSLITNKEGHTKGKIVARVA